MGIAYEANGWKVNIMPVDSSRVVLVGSNENFDNRKTDLVYTYSTAYANYKGLKAALLCM